MATKAHLGISPGTRTIGLAVMYRGELIEWKVKTFKEAWNKDKLKSILATIFRLCEYYDVGMISLKKVDPLRSSPQLDKLTVAIVRQSVLKRVKVRLYSLSDLDYDIRTGKKQTKDSLSEKVAEKHPVLKKKYLRERNNRREYYTKMFEAIAMAEQCRGE